MNNKDINKDCDSCCWEGLIDICEVCGMFEKEDSYVDEVTEQKKIKPIGNYFEKTK